MARSTSALTLCRAAASSMQSALVAQAVAPSAKASAACHRPVARLRAGEEGVVVEGTHGFWKRRRKLRVAKAAVSRPSARGDKSAAEADSDIDNRKPSPYYGLNNL
jgi:hypothetical protein